MQKSKGSSKKSVPVRCGYCGSSRVHIHRDPERAVMRCEECGKRLFAFYTDKDRWEEGNEPPPEGDAFLVRRVESDLLRQVSPPARGLYEFIKRYVGVYGYPPSYREMQRSMGVGSTSQVQTYLDQLQAVGLIERDYAVSRSIRLARLG